jgi:serine incorporator 1/3
MGALRVLCCLSVGADAARSLTIAKWAYFALFTAFSVVTWLLRSYGEQIFVQNRLFAGVCADPTTSMTVAASALCSGQQLVLRFSFGAAAFFGAHALLLFWCRREGDFRLGLHTGGWAWKLLALAGSLVGFLFMPPTAVFYYGNVARFGAGLFLVFVMVEMVAWTYDLNEALVARDAWWSWALLVSGAVISLAGGAALVGAAYYYYAPSPSCGLNIFLCTWSLVLGVAMIGVLFVPNRLEVAGLLTSGVVFAYASYLLLSALSSQPLSPCTRDMGVRQVAITVRTTLQHIALCMPLLPRAST